MSDQETEESIQKKMEIAKTYEERAKLRMKLRELKNKEVNENVLKNKTDAMNKKSQTHTSFSLKKEPPNKKSENLENKNVSEKHKSSPTISKTSFMKAECIQNEKNASNFPRNLSPFRKSFKSEDKKTSIETLQKLLEQSSSYEEKAHLRAKIKALSEGLENEFSKMNITSNLKKENRNSVGSHLENANLLEEKIVQQTSHSVEKKLVENKINSNDEKKKMSEEQVISGYISWINKALKINLESNSTSLISSTRDGSLLCKLCNIVVKGTVDERAINISDPNDSKKIKENWTLFLNSSRAIGCHFNYKESDLIIPNKEVILKILKQLLKITVLKNLEYKNVEKIPTMKKCSDCLQIPLTQYALLPPDLVICRRCTEEEHFLFQLGFEEKNKVLTTQKCEKKVINPPKKESAKDYFEKIDKERSNAPSACPFKNKTKRDGQTALLEWCQQKTFGYDGVNVQNFSESWNDGLAFCALMSSLGGDEKINFENLKKENKSTNFKLAFSTAENTFGVPQFLDVNDMLSMTRPDSLSIMTYLSSIYKSYNSGKK